MNKLLSLLENVGGIGKYNYTNPEFWMIVIGGLALFLYGIFLISKVLKKIAGKKLKTFIDKCSTNRFTGCLTGALFTAGIQSSGATSSLAIGLVRAGLMTLLQALPIIIGANIGTTITAFIVSIPIMEYMPIVLLIGSFIVMLATRNRFRNFGELFFAIGLIFFGLWVMQIQLESLSKEEFMTSFFTFLTDYPWLGLLIGAVVTALLQSSSAVVGIAQGIYAAAIISAQEAGIVCAISLFGILPIVFGSNIGSTVTAIISSIGGSKDSKRVALFHLIFNTFVSLVFMGLLYAAQSWLATSPTWAISPKLQLALVHLVFNVSGAIIFLPLINPMAKLLCKIIPGEDRRNSLMAIKELDKGILKKFPAQGISLAKDVVTTMFSYTATMFETIDCYLKDYKNDDSLFVHDIEGSIDKIDRNLNEYMLEADKGDLTDKDLKTFTMVLRGSKDIERIGDYAENIIEFFENANDRKERLTDEDYEIFSHYTKEAVNLIKQTIDVYKNDDAILSKEVIQKRRNINNELDGLITKHFENIQTNTNKVKYIDLVYVDLVNAYQRVFSHCSDVAKLVARDKVYTLSNEEIEKFNSLKDRY